MKTLGIELKRKRLNLVLKSFYLELVGHHVQTQVPASTNILLEVKSLLPSLVGWFDEKM